MISVLLALVIVGAVLGLLTLIPIIRVVLILLAS